MLFKAPYSTVIRIYNSEQNKLASAIYLKNDTLLEVKEGEQVVSNLFQTLDSWVQKYSNVFYITVGKKNYEPVSKYLTMTPCHTDLSGVSVEVQTVQETTVSLCQLTLDVSGTIVQTADLSGSNVPVDLSSSNQPVDLPGSNQPVDLSGSNQPVDLSGSNVAVDLSGSNQPVDLSGSNQPVDLSGSNQPVDLSGARTIPIVTQNRKRCCFW
jgi:hypothetical protein